MTIVQRLLANLFREWFALHRCFSAAVLDQMTAAIAAGERSHKGEIRFAVESRLAPLAVLEGLNASRRAQQVFAQLRVWDTEHNCGVLIYVLMAEHRIEIVADRGIAARVAGRMGRDLRHACARALRARSVARWQYRGYCRRACAARRHFPGNDKAHPDELPDRPVLL